MPKISIIVAAYNIENYLKKCIDSLLSQTLNDIEILVIDDGSTDNTKSIIDLYSDSRLIYFYKENGGLSDARNFGIARAKGEYIAFVDGDDYVENNMYELLYNKAIKDNNDVVECAYFKDWDDSIKLHPIKNYKNTTLKITPYNVWNKLYKTELIRFSTLEFKKGVWYEDYNFNLKLAYYIKNPDIINIPLYHYYQRENSIMHKINFKVFDDLKVIDDIYQFYSDRAEVNLEDIVYFFAKSLLGSSLFRFIKYDVQNNTNYSKNNWKILNNYSTKWKKSDLIKTVNLVNLYLLTFNKITFHIYRLLLTNYFRVKYSRRKV